MVFWLGVPRATSPQLAVTLARLGAPIAALGAAESAWNRARVDALFVGVDADLDGHRNLEARSAAQAIHVAALAETDGHLARLALARRGYAELGLGDIAAARLSFASVVEQAQRVGDGGALVDCALGMLELDRHQGQLDHALHWADEAQAAAARADRPLVFVLAIEINRASIHYERGDLVEAEAGFWAALDLVEENPQGEHARALL